MGVISKSSINKRILIFLVLIVLIIVGMFDIVSATSGGGAAVPITTTELTEQGNDYSMKPGRLKFEFDEKLYAIQVRRVNQDYATFLFMTLDMNKLDDITAYTLDDSFNLNSGEVKEIDVNGDGVKDISIKLNKIISTTSSIKSADFTIRKINVEKEKIILTNKNEDIETTVKIEEVEVQKPISEPVIVLNQESKKQPTFLEKITNWFRGLFG